MDSYVKNIDHRRLGEELDLYSFYEEAPGCPFYHPKGIFLIEYLIKKWRELHDEGNYKEIISPQLMKEELWQRSGHNDLFSELMFYSSDGESKLALKPMSCPGAILFYKRKLKSFRDLPVRLCELGHVHRNEPSGARNGLLRARSFVQDDAHLFCSKGQIKDELQSVLELAQKLLGIFGFKDFHFEISLRDYSRKGKFLGEDEMWINLENILIDLMEENKLSYIKKHGEAKFYGPSLDLHLRDSNGNNWQCSSIQIDFNLPKRFDISFINSAGEKEIPILIHRALYGSLERFLGILVEHYEGKFPFHMSPVQYRVAPISLEQLDYAKEVKKSLVKRGYRVELDERKISFSKKLRGFYASKDPYLIILGKSEMQKGLISFRSRSGEEKKEIFLEDLIKGGDDSNRLPRGCLDES